MNILPIASSSEGNCIAIDDSFTKIIMDAGLPYSKLSKKVKFSEVSGVFCTHEHQDHCKAVPQLSRRGVPLFMSRGTAQVIGERADASIFYSPLEHLKQIRVGSWYVMPFDTVHDCAEPMGFLFQSRHTKEKGIYISDSAYVAYDFSGVTHFLIEANYSEELLDDSDDEQWLKDRIRRSHFSLDDLITFFDTSDMSSAEEIHLLHLSNRNAHEAEFKDTLQRRYGVPVFSISDNETQTA